MTTETHDELLIVALQDLREGRCGLRDRLPDVASAVTDRATRSAFDDLVWRANREEEALAAMLADPAGEPNLWAGGILDDACRDKASTAPGPVLDVALIGAVRKLIAADIVSLDTAIELARHCAPGHLGALEQAQSAARDQDRIIFERLLVLARTSPNRRDAGDDRS